MNYFEFYNIPLSLNIDEGELKQQFYAKSKEFHPDFYTMESEEKQAEVLEMSTYNNQAYKVLSDWDKRLKYLLEIKNVLAEEGKNQLPQDFLMEMMDINEALMELEFDFDDSRFQATKLQAREQELRLEQSISTLKETYDDKKITQAELFQLKDYYFKRRYLLRIQENLNKFAVRK